MLIYYDPETTKVTFTMDDYPENTAFWPEGDWIQVEPGTKVTPLAAYRVIEGALVHVDINPERRLARDEVNITIGQIREQFITPISGQEMIYQAKEAEAKAYVAESPEPVDLTAYPFIEKEIGVTADTAYEVAQTFLNMAAQWRVLGSDLEQVRVATNNTVMAAATGDEISTIMTTFRTQMGAYL